MKLYNLFPGARGLNPQKPYWKFPSGAKISFRQIARDSDVYDWQGTEICCIEFDELTHFSEFQFFYMLSRNRSMCGISPYVRAGCNPDADSWVAKFIEWWIDPDTGYPIKERSGAIRWMLRRDEVVYWADTKEELWERFDLVTEEQRSYPKSVAFVPSTIYDNQILLKTDPGYMANLEAQSIVERERLLYGNWKIKAAKGLFFPRNAIPELLEHIPNDVVRWVRAWDLAATDTDEGGDPAYTASVLLGKRKDGSYVLADATNHRYKAEKVRNLVKQCAVSDKAKYKRVRIRMSIDPGQAGKEQYQSYVKMLAGFSVNGVRESGTKEARAEPFAAQWQAGNVSVVAGPWTEALLGQYESFPESKFKDMVDAGANAFNELEMMNSSSGPPKDTGTSVIKKTSYWLK